MAPQIINVGHSPDPDDAFMFYALAHEKLDTGNLRFRHELQDIETLNRRALRGELEVTAISIHAYAYLSERYECYTASNFDEAVALLQSKEFMLVLSDMIMPGRSGIELLREINARARHFAKLTQFRL